MLRSEFVSSSRLPAIDPAQIVRNPFRINSEGVSDCW
jgi:hypothetical protein